MHESNASYRQIFFDGRKLPEDMLPTWNVAHWEGDTLVVESAGYRDDSWLDTTGNFFSNAARITERIRRPNFGSFDINVTIDDPKVFTKAWTVALHMRPLLDTEMIDFMCQENNKTSTTSSDNRVDCSSTRLPSCTGFVLENRPR